MTIETTENKPAAAPPASQAPAQAAPQVDVEKIQANAVKAAEVAATKIAGDKLKQIGQAMTGESDKPAHNPLLEQFLLDPAKTLHSVKEIAKKEVKKEMNDERAEVTRIENIQRSVGSDYIGKYPEINTKKKLEVVEAFTAVHEREGKTYEEALKLGFEDAVKEFGIQSVEDAQRNGAYGRSGLPGGGGMAPNSPKFNEEKSQNDFIAGMRAKASSTRTKTQK